MNNQPERPTGLTSVADGLAATALTVEERVLDERSTAVSAGTVELAEIGPWVSAALGRVAAVLASQRVIPSGPPYVRYFPVGAQRFHVEAGFPVPRPIDRQADVGPATLPGGTALVTIHCGPYDRISEAYTRVEAAAAERGLAVEPDPWEVYLTDPSVDSDPATWRTEVVVPLRTEGPKSAAAPV